MTDLGGDVEGDGDVVGGGSGGQSGGVVREHLVGAGLHEQCRQAGEIGEDRAD